MTTVLLLLHGRTGAEADGILTGWLPDVHLDDVGRHQAQALAQRLKEVRFGALLTSPMERCRETCALITPSKRRDLPLHTEVDFAELRYGDWTGRSLEVVAKEDLWELLQRTPSAARFPGGESYPDVQARAIRAIRKWNERLGPSATYAVVTHAAVIKVLLADALGMHVDLCHRIELTPGSASVVHYGAGPAVVARVNDTGGELGQYSPRRRPRSRRSPGARR